MRHIPAYAVLLTLVVGSLASGCKQGPGRYESIALRCMNSSKAQFLPTTARRELVRLGRNLDGGSPCETIDDGCQQMISQAKLWLENMEREGCR
jgi:hypothetical protein